MAVKGGLGRGLNGGGKGINSLIPPAKKENKQQETLQDETKKAPAKIARGKSKDAAPERVVEIEKIVEVPADHYVKVTEIEPNRAQPRRNFDEDALFELADSIRQYGVLNPILVQKKGDYYEIIAGERRWRAAKLAGLKEVPVVVREVSAQELVEVSLIENIQRENLNPVEEAQAYQRLLTEFQLKQDEVAERVSKSRTAITNSLRLLKLDERVQQMLIDQMISAGHARALLSLENQELQYTTAMRVFDEKLSVRETERIVRQLLQPAKTVRAKTVLSPELQIVYRDLSEKMSAVMGTKVAVNSKSQDRGKIEISYHSNAELERLTQLIISSNENN
ncbi:MAG: ParB/RepB/Spo0J family partition protein [Lachnospiraceae bacterium]